MLADHAKELIELLEKRDGLKEQVQRLSGFQSRQSEFAAAVAELSPRIETVNALLARGVKGPDVKDRAIPLLQRIIEIETNFGKDPSWLISQGHFAYHPFKRNIESLTDALDYYLKQAWQDYTVTRVRQINAGLLNALGAVPGFAATVREIRQLLTQIEQRRNRIPQSENDLIIFDKLTEKIDEAWYKLDSDDLPGGVMLFLQAAAREGAALNLFTEEVKNWLTTHKVTGSFKIRTVA